MVMQYEFRRLRVFSKTKLIVHRYAATAFDRESGHVHVNPADLYKRPADPVPTANLGPYRLKRDLFGQPALR